MVSVAPSLIPKPAASAQKRTWKVGIWIVSASANTDFGHQKASHYISGSQWWLMIEWWILNACTSKQESQVLNISSIVMQCSSRGEDGVLKVLEIVSKVGRQGKYI
jgi:hypothetical protein